MGEATTELKEEQDRGPCGTVGPHENTVPEKDGGTCA